MGRGVGNFFFPRRVAIAKQCGMLNTQTKSAFDGPFTKGGRELYYKMERSDVFIGEGGGGGGGGGVRSQKLRLTGERREGKG